MDSGACGGWLGPLMLTVKRCRMKSHFLEFGSAIAVALAVGAPGRAWAQAGIEAVEREVLTAFLSSGSGFQPGATNYVVMGTTYSERVRSTATRLREEAKRRDASVREAIEDLIHKSTTDLPVKTLTNQAAQVTVLSEEEFGSIVHGLGPASWAAFFQKFPGAGGTIRISRIGTDASKTVAILDVIESAHGIGRTRFCLLRRDGQAWRLASERILGMEDRYGMTEPALPIGPRLNQPVERMAAGGSVWSIPTDWAAAPAQFCRWAEHE
jgi:hypothetical protein